MDEIIKTNRDRLNKMSNKEMAGFLFSKDIIGCCNREHCDLDLCAKKLESWLNAKVELTADEIFKEIGYVFDGVRYNSFNYKAWQYVKQNGNEQDRIIIDTVDNKKFNYIKHKTKGWTLFSAEFLKSNTITEDEDLAIHKKIEELKIQIKGE